MFRYNRTLLASMFLLIISLYSYSLEDSFLDDSFLESNTEEFSSGEFENATDSFLDDSFTTNETIANPIISEEEPFKQTNYETVRQSFSLLKFFLIDTFSYNIAHYDSTFNKEELFYNSPWNNTLQFNNFIQYKNKQRWLELKMDYNLYYTVQPTSATDFEKEHVSNTLDTVFQYELKEATATVSFFENKIKLRIGKIFNSFGSAFLVNPSNPLARNYGNSMQFAKNITVEKYSTTDLQTIHREQGTGDDIGYWATEFELSWYPIVWHIAYLPSMTTGFKEFDRPEHSMLTTLGINVWDTVHPSLLFFLYGKNYSAGADISVGLGDYLTLHGEIGLSFENELLILKETSTTILGPTTRLQEYSLEPYSTEGVYSSGILGISYTPQIETTSLATILLELYYNGKGLWQSDWDDQIDFRNDINALYSDTFSSSTFGAFSGKCKGMLNISRYYYNPLDVRPLYMLIRISRENILNRIWTQDLNVETSMVYSLLDTTFLWDMGIEIVLQDLISVGVQSRYIFGLPNGAFTELVDNFVFSVYSKVEM